MIAATAMIPSASQLASARCHLEARASWTYYRVNGVRYVAIQSATSGKTYQVRADGKGCSCRFYEVHKALCSHAVAVIEAANQDALSEYLADAADALLEEYDSQQQQATATTWRACKKQCGALLPPEDTRPLCSHCAERGLLLAFGGED